MRWLLHLDDHARRLTLGIVDGTLAALARAPAGSAEATSITVVRATRIAGRARNVSVVIEGRSLTLEIVVKGMPPRAGFHLLGPVVTDDDEPRSSRATMLATLEDWRLRLTAEPTNERIAATRRVESDLKALLTGAVEALEGRGASRGCIRTRPPAIRSTCCRVRPAA